MRDHVPLPCLLLTSDGSFRLTTEFQTLTCKTSGVLIKSHLQASPSTFNQPYHQPSTNPSISCNQWHHLLQELGLGNGVRFPQSKLRQKGVSNRILKNNFRDTKIPTDPSREVLKKNHLHFFEPHKSKHMII